MKVLVVGGVSGLGQALVELALSHGSEVIVFDNDPAGLALHASNVITRFCDIADITSIDAALSSITIHSPFDLVAITAGINAVGRFEELNPSAMSRVVAVNLTGTMQLTRELVTRGLIARGGRLVLTSSLSHFVGYPGASAYAASKDGVAVFGISIRQELRRKHGITVQVVAPGPMDTPHAERYAPPGSRGAHRTRPQAIAESILERRQAGLFVPSVGAALVAVIGSLVPSLAGRVMHRLIYLRLHKD